MGITISYCIRLQASFSQDAATAAIARLWQACRRLPFQAQTPMITLDEGRIRAALTGVGDQADWQWACRQHQRMVCYTHDHLGVPHIIPGDARVQEAIHARISANLLIGFSLLAGAGCEACHVFVGGFPNSLMAACRGTQHGYPAGRRRLMLATPLRWTGAAFCRTQYACVPEAGGITNFLRCHLAVVAALDAARDVGFGVEVRDDSGYWAMRNVPALVQAVGDWNAYLLGAGQRLRAVFGDQVKTAIDPAAMAGPMNMAAAARLGDDVLALIKLTGGTFTPTPAAGAAGASASNTTTNQELLP